MTKDKDNPEGFVRSSIPAGGYIDQRVTSHNQRGGVTAHTVNFAPPPRHMTEELKADLLRHVSKDRFVKVDSPFSDAEAYNLAHEIWEFLKANGYNVCEEHAQSIRHPPSPPGIGIDLETNPDVADIAVGPRA